MQESLPKVLVVSINAWKDNSGINTLIDLFKNWEKDKIAQIYTRSSLPSTKVCNRFFQISENAVIKSIFNRKKVTGRIVSNEMKIDKDLKENIEQENSLYSKIRKRRSQLLSLARELFWVIGHWRTKELRQFVEDFDADILFLPVYPTIYMGLIQNYLIKITGKPAVCYLADDNYTYQTCGINPLSYIHRFFLRRQVRNIVNSCSKMFVIAPKQKEECDRIFGIESIILTKGIDYSQLYYEELQLNTPIKMVYTGKLIIGRWKSLVSIAEKLGEINKDTIKITLDIYTTDQVKPSILKKLNRNGCKVRGAIPMNKVAKVQANSDIVVFVESLDWRYKNLARLSFSTKLTDYFKSGKCIFAVGDKDIAPIDYLLRNECAIVSGSYREIGRNLENIVDNPDLLKEYSRKSFEIGKKNHNKIIIDRNLKSTISNICELQSQEKNQIN
ncbi:hypothetical protein [Neobacillus sp. SAB-20_R2A]|uniref:hypothetical protein n=1 Tax=Neobacillus sp. SAB-20_R2A TaxID=3120519 RepID=UPI003C6E86B7